MIKNEYKVVGVMSGTSLDGVDVVYVEFELDDVWHFKMIHFETVSYNSSWENILRNLVSYNVAELQKIDEDYTNYLSGIIKDFINKNSIKDIDAICSHGHTALHRPDIGMTYQIGNQPVIAVLLNETVVCDFRVQDVELRGQGAPLVPIGDKLLFSEYDFCLNLGGFANISTEIKNKRIAYDICPVNIVLNHYTKLIGLDYDDGGKMARTGTVNNKLLDKLNSLAFYKENYPKSLGLEWVIKNMFPLIDAFQLDTKDILKTFAEHIAIQIAKEINKKKHGSVLVTGGGVYNNYLIDTLKQYSQHEIIIPLNEVVEFKEALIFGLLGVLKLRNEVNCLKSVTGSTKNHSSGKIFLP
ncbi:anhydro-N-acetylmuramic acid kinase [Flavivirga spongiicola]|uniref:Anhydro-N-acetylmuramic acid kinase n=1 Tax=Flavivirga spongiicola TaxID=421621 RepID=A0ABU7XRG3_9FLAO|nr:anhydro-N-acetylmuramic acid kinase [Flavivirga sp. MEBiC05379]MDO5978136.1 anhydro-N-acetylmuramic acid kinase [Flavivirga sp. MEBiC05379]